jgi:ubiquitin C-terminal hydrolase
LHKNAKIGQQSRYTLKGIVHHQGEAEYGHYYSEVCCEGKWYQMNDVIVEEEKGPELSSYTAYLLFY